MGIFILFALSQKVYELERCIIPHFKALDLSFWHFKFNCGSVIEYFRAKKQQMCLILFGSDFSGKYEPRGLRCGSTLNSLLK